MGVEPKIGVGVSPPNHPLKNRVWNHYKPSILGYHYFWKDPYMDVMDISVFVCFFGGKAGFLTKLIMEVLLLIWLRSCTSFFSFPPKGSVGSALTAIDRSKIYFVVASL